ncbi:MAG TPA: dihydropteroate synthase [Puia sp.]|jgi:dihydropteroate synthase|nr:dihydropteroate synthase [Puia sp.]
MFSLNCNGKLLTINNPIVMGIINVTPDSFYAGSRFIGEKEILRQIEKMIKEEVDIVDIGGQSTRPRAQQLSIDEELKRIISVINSLHKNFPELIISIDTFYSQVAKESVAAGASIINDISGGNFDGEMLSTVAKLKVPYVCMHIKGTPQTMQEKPEYENVTKEILDFFIERIDACKKAGIDDIIIDPGFGFGKNSRHNFELLKNLSVFKMLEKPILTGISRKSTIYKTLGITVDEALNGNTVLHTIALMNGANILRAHDVKEAKECIKLFTEYSKS